MSPWALPLGAFFLLLLAARKSHGSHESHPDGTRSLPLQKEKKTPTRIHHGFFPSAGLVEVAGDLAWTWNGQVWLHNGSPGYPAGLFLHGVNGGPLDGWVYDWHLQAWVEPGDGDKLHHRNFYPPAGAVAVKGDSSFIWDGGQWIKNGIPTFPQGKDLVGVGPWEGWHYDWKEQAWVEPLLMHEQAMRPAGNAEKRGVPSTSQSASSPVAPTSSISVISSTRIDTPMIRDEASPKSSIRTISSGPLQTKDSPATKQSVASAIRELKQDPDPHPQKIANVASMASSAGLHETASVLSTVAVQKAQEKNIPITDTASTSTIKVSSVTPISSALSNTQRVNEEQKLEQSVQSFSHAADPASASASMTFEPEVISHSSDAPAMTFEPEVIQQTPQLSSPLDGVNDDEWSHFAVLLEDPHNKVNDRWELGTFKIGARRLVDLGMAKDPRQVQRNGKSVWIADFIPPLSMQIFVNDEHMQYDTFVKEMQYLSRGIEERGTKGKIPLSIHGVSPTRSGLLAVAKLAGLQGLDSFMKDDGDWEKFPNTRDAFLKANGVF